MCDQMSICDELSELQMDKTLFLPDTTRNWGWSDDPALDPSFLKDKFLPDSLDDTASCTSSQVSEPSCNWNDSCASSQDSGS
jgi:hypothetical protein